MTHGQSKMRINITDKWIYNYFCLLIAAFDLLKANYSNYAYIKSVSLVEYAIY